MYIISIQKLYLQQFYRGGGGQENETTINPNGGPWGFPQKSRNETAPEPQQEERLLALHEGILDCAKLVAARMVRGQLAMGILW